MVFDGGPLPCKREEEEYRRKYVLCDVGVVRRCSPKGNSCLIKVTRQASRNWWMLLTYHLISLIG